MRRWRPALASQKRYFRSRRERHFAARRPARSNKNLSLGCEQKWHPSRPAGICLMLDDIEFVARIKSLRENIPAMREFLKTPGHLDRLFDLAIKGAKKPSKSKARSSLPQGFPDKAQIDRACAFWALQKRPDLAVAAELQAAEFRDHHTGRGTLAADWPATWGTWMRRALQFTRPPRTGPAPVPAEFEQTNLDGWLRRLEIFHLGDDDDNYPAHVGSWSPRWGAKPGETGNRIPPAAWAEFEKYHPGRRAAAK
jgi:hypothetical protein